MSYCSILFSVPLQFPIDVIIPCAEKDLRTLELCIDGIKTYGKNVNRIIIVSSKKLSDNAEWFDEAQYPFSKYDIIFQVFKDHDKTVAYLTSKNNRSGWVYQQLLKLYAPFVIPDLSPYVLVLDADTIFLNPVEFINDQGEILYNPGTEYNPAYFQHGKRLIPSFRKVYPHYSGISHHMIFHYETLCQLFSLVEKYHQKEFWKAFCELIDHHHLLGSPVSEYELYFNFIFSSSSDVKIRQLQWTDTPFNHNLNFYKHQGYHYISCHTYL